MTSFSKTPLVGLDISQLAHIGGVNTYTQALSKGLAQDKTIQTVFFYSSLRKPYRGKLKMSKAIDYPQLFLRFYSTKSAMFPSNSLLVPLISFIAPTGSNLPQKL